MKEAHECLKLASHCEDLADMANDSDGQRQYLQLAKQWRKLADDSLRHKQMVSMGTADRDAWS